MPKLKVHKTAVKRFKITGRKKLLRWPSETSHLRAKESASGHKRKEQLRPVSKTQTKRLRRLMNFS